MLLTLTALKIDPKENSLATLTKIESKYQIHYVVDY